MFFNNSCNSMLPLLIIVILVLCMCGGSSNTSTAPFSNGCGTTYM